MKSSQRSTSNILKIFKPKKLRAVFFVLLAIFFLTFSAKISLAETYTDSQKYDLKNTYGLNQTQITNLEKSNTSFDNFVKKVNDELSGAMYSKPPSASEIKTAANAAYNGAVDPGIADATGLQTTNPDVGLTSALKGLGFVLAESVLAVVIGILGVFVAFAKYLVVFSAQVLDFTLNPALYNFTSNKMIVEGWTVVRDVCNLFFLLVLLFIAICTILKIEKYHAKKTLLTLIIMALLINFSKPITIFVFDGSQLLMNFFLDQIGKTGTGSESGSALITKAAEISDFIYQSLPGYWSSKDSSLNMAIQYIFAAVFLFMLAVSYLVTALMLIIRIVAIMMLIIVSPFAFFAAIIPDFSKISSKWWSALFEYSYYGPAAAFFLLLATKLENALPHLSAATNPTEGVAKSLTEQSLQVTVNNITHYLTVLVFLYASIFMAKQFGGAAGAAIVGNANRVMKWAGGMTKGGGMWGSLARGTGQVTGVSNMYRGAKEGVSQQPFWRMLTKKGREASSKESQEKWEEKVAPFNIANVRKKQKEMENDAQSKVDAGVSKGNAASILEASRRGTLTSAQMQDPKVKKLLQQYPDIQKDIFKNLADKGQTFKRAEFEATSQIGAPGTVNGGKMNDINAEIYKNTSNNKLVEQDLAGALHNERDRGGDFLHNRLVNYHATNEDGFKQLYNKATNQHTIAILDNIKAGRPPLSGGVPRPS